MLFAEGSKFSDFLTNDVSSRLNDIEGRDALTSHLAGLASTGFEQANLEVILNAELPEERDWAIAEALAEAWLSRQYSVLWPWNMERDKRTPLASLPGADLVGFVRRGSETYLVLGEVKSSSDVSTPPNVMSGRKGMAHQIENLVADLRLLFTLIRWLHPRCKGTAFQQYFDSAIRALLQSGNKAITLFGILVRDTSPDELDLRTRGQHLASAIATPGSCHLLGLYLPCKIARLPDLLQERGKP